MVLEKKGIDTNESTQEGRGEAEKILDAISPGPSCLNAVRKIKYSINSAGPDSARRNDSCRYGYASWRRY